MSKSLLPPKPSLEKLKKQAKALAKAHKSGDVSVCKTLRLVHRFKALTDQEILQAPVTLNDSQFALALSYGFRDWNELKRHTDSETAVQRGVEQVSKRTQEANARAREHAEKAIELAPDSAEAHLLLGSTHLWDWEVAEDPKPPEQLDLAYKSVREALSLDADLGSAHVMLAAIYVYRKQQALAMAEIEKALSLAPDSAAVQAKLARVFLALGMPEEALRTIRKAIRLDPQKDHYAFLDTVYANLVRDEASYEVFKSDIDAQWRSFALSLQPGTSTGMAGNAGLQTAIEGVFPIQNAAGDAALEYVSHRLDDVEHSANQCIRSGMTYGMPVLVTVRFAVYDVDKMSGTAKIRGAKEQEIHLGSIPLMTNRRTFIINGMERTAYNHHGRSCGLFLGHDRSEEAYRCRIIPVRGSWLEMEVDEEGIVYARIDRRRKFPITTLLKALGYTAEDMRESGLFCGNGVSGSDPIRKTLHLDKTDDTQDALMEIHRLQRPGVSVMPETARDFLKSLFFRAFVYDLSGVGRLRINHRLGIDAPLDLRYLRKEDILLAVKALVELSDTKGLADGTDPLGSVGELLVHLYRTGLMRAARESKERMSQQPVDALKPGDLLSSKPISAALEEFFGRSADSSWYP